MLWDTIWRGQFKLRHLLVMTTVGEVGSLGGAAQRLRITQPAASRLLAEIEAVVGVPVFDRLPRGLVPNAYGEALIRRARRALAELGAAKHEIDALRAGLSGPVALGTVAGPAVSVVARVLTRLSVASPGVQVSVEVAPSPVLVRMLLDGKLDFALARLPDGIDTKDLDYRQVDDEEVSFLVGQDHPLAAHEELRLADIAPLPWVLEPPGSLMRRRIDLMFRSAALAPPTQVVNTSSYVLAIAMLTRGEHVGALASPVAAMCTRFGGLRRFDAVRDVGRVTVQPLGLIRRRDQLMSPAVEYLYVTIQDHYAAGSDGEP